MSRKVKVEKAESGKYLATDTTNNQPILEADTVEEVQGAFSQEFPSGEFELELPGEAKPTEEGTTESTTKLTETGKKGAEGAAQESAEEDSEEEEDPGKTVPLAALKAERTKRQGLEVALGEMAALRQEIAALREAAAVKPKTQDEIEAEQEEMSAPVTKKDLLAFFQAQQNEMKAARADDVIKEMAGMEKAEGMLLSPKDVIELTAPFLKQDPEARRILVETEDKNDALRQLERVALMTIALRNPSSLTTLTKPTTPTKPTRETAAVAASRKIDALAAGAKIHDALSQGGDEGGTFTDPVEAHIAKLQSITDPVQYSAYWKKLTPEVRAAVDERLGI